MPMPDSAPALQRPCSFLHNLHRSVFLLLAIVVNEEFARRDEAPTVDDRIVEPVPGCLTVSILVLHKEELEALLIGGGEAKGFRNGESDQIVCIIGSVLDVDVHHTRVHTPRNEDFCASTEYVWEVRISDGVPVVVWVRALGPTLTLDLHWAFLEIGRPATLQTAIAGQGRVVSEEQIHIGVENM
eukprot:CAMPEP_0114374150 /NCGR_PEP_ID=MMETSP0101-20121206/35379_1 /TAXON_ID=38822 ORGANISM="Pteridomonas danica, Strain PT" /NCGR_SAMPLE_ID=MMETSP0101 /ASSEMBLY_ACC=CAM_ASM_000211 /LENGTH=184 /DNA_ID=CAMNT_0001527705 /DNA_START=255 /DNA_END=809 /DNA_ORIENTATION=-